MPEVGLGVGLERFALLARGEVECVVDIVDNETASVTLTALPDFPLALEAARARQFVAAWEKRAELEGQSYEVRKEQREV
jgi:hypothetical protein